MIPAGREARLHVLWGKDIEPTLAGMATGSLVAAEAPPSISAFSRFCGSLSGFFVSCFIRRTNLNVDKDQSPISKH